MNALVAVRSNRVGQLSPTPEIRSQVRRELATTAAAREGLVAREMSPSLTVQQRLSEQAAAPTSSALQTRSGETVSESNTETRVVNDDDLNKDAFLQLLVLQMQNQDPLEPMDNADMLAQLAQFSSLEAQTNLNDSFQQISGNIDQLNFMTASQMLGKFVEGVDINGQLHSGMVDGVHLDGSLVVLSVDGVFMSMAGVIRVENEEPATDGGSGDGNGDDGGVEVVIDDPGPESAEEL